MRAFRPALPRAAARTGARIVFDINAGKSRRVDRVGHLNQNKQTKITTTNRVGHLVALLRRPAWTPFYERSTVSHAEAWRRSGADLWVSECDDQFLDQGAW